MARPKITDAQKMREGALLTTLFLRAQRADQDLTQESLAGELGLTQGLVAQWLSGRTVVPDRRLVWLGERLGFDPLIVRPDLSDLALLSRLSGNARLHATIQKIPSGEEEYIAGVIEAILAARKQDDP